MVASKTSIIVAAVALGAATAYAAPTAFNNDVALSRREADESTLIAREFNDDELYAREFYDDLDARDFDDLEVRDFDDDELYARELYEDELEARELYGDELEARELYGDELEARELYGDELEARDFEDYENLFARAVEEATPSKNSTSTPSSTATSSISTPSSTSTGAKNDEHVVATPTSTPSPTSTTDADEGHHKDHKEHKEHKDHKDRDICKPYVKAYKLLAVQFGHESHEHDLHEHHSLYHDIHKYDIHKHIHKHDRHPHHRHHHHRQRHHLSAGEIAEICGPKIAKLVKLAADHGHGKAADATTAHSTESKTLKVETPTKAKRDLTRLWARVLQVGESPQVDLKTPGSQNPDTAGSSNAQSLVPGGADGSVPSTLSGGSEKPLPGSVSDNQQYKKPQGPHRHHHQRPGHHGHWHRQHHHHHHHHHGPGNHGHRRPHHRGDRQRGQHQVPGALDTTKSVTDTAVNSGVPPINGDATPVSMSGASGDKPQANAAGAPATPNSALPGVRRRSLLGDNVFWKRTLAGSLGLDLDYFTKRFYDEDGVQY